MLITTWVGMQLAKSSCLTLSTLGPSLSGQLILFTSLGIAFAGGAAAVINQILDRHCDRRMERTARRPLVTGRVSLCQAFWFAILLMVFGLGILTFGVNALTALLTALTVMGYAFLYTLFLKRASPQNIVIGGAAGAMPPLLGWTAVTNQIDAQAWLLVLIIFTWTPPHFWALAIAKREEYAKAGIPMLPVTHGVAFTKLSILLYTILLLVVTILPYLSGLFSFYYLTAALLLGLAFLRQTLLLYRSSAKRVAMQTFQYSIFYLLLLFIAMLIDKQLISSI